MQATRPNPFINETKPIRWLYRHVLPSHISILLPRDKPLAKIRTKPNTKSNMGVEIVDIIKYLTNPVT